MCLFLDMPPDYMEPAGPPTCPPYYDLPAGLMVPLVGVRFLLPLSGVHSRTTQRQGTNYRANSRGLPVQTFVVGWDIKFYKFPLVFNSK